MNENLNDVVENVVGNVAEEVNEVAAPVTTVITGGNFTAKDVVISGLAGVAVGAVSTQVPKFVRFVAGKIRKVIPKKKEGEIVDGTASEQPIIKNIDLNDCDK